MPPKKDTKKKAADKKNATGGKGKDKGKGKGKTEKDSPKKEAEEEFKIVFKTRLATTWDDLRQHRFNLFRCNECRVVFNGFVQFMTHYCWKKYYEMELHFGETQAFICRNCYRMYNNDSDYAVHVCTRREPEDILPISYQDNFDFYKMWRRRIRRETEPHDPDTFYVVRCATCGRRYKNTFAFLIHSCIAVHDLSVKNIQKLCYCRHCKLVFGDREQYDTHVAQMCFAEKAFCLQLPTTRIERACQQFLLMRHRAEEQLEDEPPLRDCPNICFKCAIEYPSISEYMYHPCVAGKTISPVDLELTLLCRECHRLFTDLTTCQKHLLSCNTLGFYYLRFNRDDLALALERFIEDDLSNVHLDQRPKKFMCRICHEIFRDLGPYLAHSCPTKGREKRRLFIQPSRLMEMYVCNSCFVVCLSALEAQAHTEECPRNERANLLWLHLTKTECLTALEPWSKKPNVLELPLDLSTQPLEPSGTCAS